MYIHNTTFNIENSALQLWKIWMKNSFLKKSLAHEFIKSHTVLKVHLENEHEEIITIQLKTESKELCELFDKEYMPHFKQELYLAFGEKVLLFTSHLEEL